MKKLITIAAMAMLATVSWAQIVTTAVNNVTVLAGPLNIDVKVKLSDGTAPAVTGLQWALVALQTGSFSGQVIDVIGTEITTTTNIDVDATNVTSQVDLSTNIVLSSIPDGAVGLGKGKFGDVLSQINSDTAQPFGMSNSTWFVQGSLKATKGTNVSAKVEGLWKSGDTAFKGSIKTSKVK